MYIANTCKLVCVCMLPADNYLLKNDDHCP